MSENHGSDMFVAFGIGMLVGAGAALLLAPSSGEEARRRIGRLGQEALDLAKERGGDAGDFVKRQADRVGAAIHEGKEAYQREAQRT